MNTTEAPTTPPRRPLWHRVLRGIVKAGVALFVLLLVGRLAWGYIEARRMDALIAGIKSAGEPLTFEELDAGLPKVAEIDDAGPYYEAALALVQACDEEALWDAASDYAEALRETPASRPSPQQTEAIGRLLARNAAALEMVDRGARLPGCGLDSGVQNGIEFTLERLSRARVAAKLLSARALAQAAAGQGDEAVDSLITVIRLGRMFERRPIMIAWLVRVVFVSLASRDAALVLEISDPSEAALIRLADSLNATDQPGIYTRVLLAERIYSLQLMREVIANAPQAEANEKSPVGAMFPSPSWETRPWLQHMAIGLLSDLAELIRWSRKPVPEALAAMEETKVNDPLGKLLLAPVQRTLVLSTISVANARCAAAAALVERYRAANGRLPASLAELGSELPAAALTDRYARLHTRGVLGELPAAALTDPFTDRPLIYRTQGDGYVIYAVGENLKDDGGAVTRPKGSSDRLLDIGTMIRK